MDWLVLPPIANSPSLSTEFYYRDDELWPSRSRALNALWNSPPVAAIFGVRSTPGYDYDSSAVAGEDDRDAEKDADEDADVDMGTDTDTDTWTWHAHRDLIKEARLLHHRLDLAAQCTLRAPNPRACAQGISTHATGPSAYLGIVRKGRELCTTFQTNMDTTVVPQLARFYRRIRLVHVGTLERIAHFTTNGSSPEMDVPDMSADLTAVLLFRLITAAIHAEISAVSTFCDRYVELHDQILAQTTHTDSILTRLRAYMDTFLIPLENDMKATAVEAGRGWACDWDYHHLRRKEQCRWPEDVGIPLHTYTYGQWLRKDLSERFPRLFSAPQPPLSPELRRLGLLKRVGSLEGTEWVKATGKSQGAGSSAEKSWAEAVLERAVRSDWGSIFDMHKKRCKNYIRIAERRRMGENHEWNGEERTAAG